MAGKNFSDYWEEVMEMLKIEGKVSKRTKALELKGEIFCVTTEQLPVRDLKEEEELGKKEKSDEE